MLTQEAERFAGHIARNHPDLAEPVEGMVEAVVELVTQPHVGRLVASRPFLHALGRPVRSLDGSEVLKDVQLPADLDAGVA